MEVIEIVKTVVMIIVFIYSVITTIIAIRKSRNNGKSICVDNKDFMSILNNNLVKYMTSAETFFKGITAVGMKTGTLKEDQVVDKIKLDCLQNGVEFDDKATKAKIKEIVDFKNS